MICQTIQHNRDNVLVTLDLDILRVISDPLESSKDETPLWLFVDLLEGAKHKRDQLNYNNLHALIIEFDSGLTIPEFEERYSYLEYYLHTTSSHSSEKHRFRVILPLDEPYPYQLFKHRFVKPCMVEYFKGLDPSCFSNFQKLPALPKVQSEYYYKYNSGIYFSYALIRHNVDTMILKEQKEEERRIKLIEYRRANNPNHPNLEKYKAKVVENIQSEIYSIPRTKCGHRYTDLVRVTGKMLAAKYPDGDHIFDLEEIEDLVLGHTNSSNVKKMIRDLERHRK